MFFHANKRVYPAGAESDKIVLRVDVTKTQLYTSASLRYTDFHCYGERAYNNLSSYNDYQVFNERKYKMFTKHKSFSNISNKSWLFYFWKINLPCSIKGFWLSFFPPLFLWGILFTPFPYPALSSPFPHFSNPRTSYSWLGLHDCFPVVSLVLVAPKKTGQWERQRPIPKVSSLKHRTGKLKLLHFLSTPFQPILLQLISSSELEGAKAHCTWAREEATLFWLLSIFLQSSPEGCPQSSRTVSLGSWLNSWQLPSELAMSFARVLSPPLKQQLSPTQLQIWKPSWVPKATEVQRVGKTAYKLFLGIHKHRLSNQHQLSSEGARNTVYKTKKTSRAKNPPQTSHGVSRELSKALCTKHHFLFPAQLLSLVQPGQLANVSCLAGDATEGWQQWASSASTGREASELRTACQLKFANRTRILLER